MADEVDPKPAEAATPAPAPEPEFIPDSEVVPVEDDGTPENHAVSIMKAVDEFLKAGNSGMKERVVKVMAEPRAQEREKMLVDAVGKAMALQQEVKQLKKKGEQRYDGEGKLVEPMLYTKQQWEEYSKAKQKLDKLTLALDKAFNQADYSKLTECMRQEQKPQQQGGK